MGDCIFQLHVCPILLLPTVQHINSIAHLQEAHRQLHVFVICRSFRKIGIDLGRINCYIASFCYYLFCCRKPIHIVVCSCYCPTDVYFHSSHPFINCSMFSLVILILLYFPLDLFQCLRMDPVDLRPFISHSDAYFLPLHSDDIPKSA